MPENYAVLLIAILAPRVLTVEEAFDAFTNAKVSPRHSNISDIAPAMILMRQDGESWVEIAKCFGFISNNSAQKAVIRYRKKGGEAACSTNR